MRQCTCFSPPSLPSSSSSSSHCCPCLSVQLSSWAFCSSCGLRHVQCFCLHAHFAAPAFSSSVCGSCSTRSRDITVVRGVRQRQQQALRIQRCQWPWPGNLLCTLPGWGVSVGFQLKPVCIFVFKLRRKSTLWILLDIHIGTSSSSVVTPIILYENRLLLCFKTLLFSKHVCFAAVMFSFWNIL